MTETHSTRVVKAYQHSLREWYRFSSDAAMEVDDTTAAICNGLGVQMDEYKHAPVTRRGDEVHIKNGTIVVASDKTVRFCIEATFKLDFDERALKYQIPVTIQPSNESPNGWLLALGNGARRVSRAVETDFNALITELANGITEAFRERGRVDGLQQL